VVLRVENLAKIYQKTLVVNKISLKVNEGGIVGLL